MIHRVTWLASASVLVLTLGGSGPCRRALGQEEAEAGKVVLTVVGAVERPLTLTAADLAKFPRRSVQARDHHDKEGTWDGVSLHDLLEKAGVPSGTALRGRALSLSLVVEAADGYRVVFALPELDPAYNDRVVLLADRRDGSALPAGEGPLRIVVPGEKMHARWVRQVVALKIVKN